MTKLIFFLFVSLPIAAQTLTYLDATTTQASVSVSGAACSFELRETDASGTRLTAIEAAAELVVTRSDGVREYLLGKPYGSLALAAARKYYLDCDGAAAITFTTATIGMANIAPRAMPWNSAKPNNLDYPEISLAPADAENTYTDPVTGLGGVKLLNTTAGFAYQGGPFAFTKRGGAATNWTNPDNLLSLGSTTNYATSAGTTAMDLYPAVGSTNAIDDEPMDTIGIRVWGSAVSTAGDDETYRLCWFRDPDGACISDNVDVSLPGSIALVNTFPTAYPTIWGASSGWGATFKIRREDMPVSGTMTCASSTTCTVASPSSTSYIPSGVGANTRIYIAGSGCSGNGSADVCEIASVTNATSIVLTTSVNVTGAAFTVWPLGLRITPLTAASKNIGVGWVFAGTEGSVPAAEGMGFCNMNEFTTGDGIRGHLCAVRGKIADRHIYFVSNDGATRRRVVWGRPPFAEINATYADANDQASQADLNGDVIAFHPTLANAWYVNHNTNGGKPAIWLVTYDGDGTTEATFNYTGSYDTTFPEGTDNVTYENKTRFSLGKDPQSLVTASGISYNSGLYGAVNGANFSWNGVSGDMAGFRIQYQGQDVGPMWIGAIDLTSQTLVDFWHTFDGGQNNFGFRWCNGHSFPMAVWPLRTQMISCNTLPFYGGSTSHLHLGAHTVIPNGLKMSLAQCNARGGTHDGTYCTNTALDPTDVTGYDAACPSDIAQIYKDYGATGNNCATLKLPHQPANSFTGATELAAFGQCSGASAGKTCPLALKVGDRFVDPAWAGGEAGAQSVGDGENLLVVKLVSALEVVVQRHASWEYTCPVGSGGGKANCAQSTSQYTHANGWKALMAPGTIHAQGALSGYITYTGTTPSPVYAMGAFGGHSSLGRYGNNTLFVSGSASVYNQALSTLQNWPLYGSDDSVAFKFAQPTWNGATASIGSGTQQYLNCGAYAATGAYRDYCLDANAYNNNNAILSQSIGASLGAQTLTAGTGTDVWKITIGHGTLAYKTRPLHGWVGKYMLRDITPATIATAADYSLCLVYRAGDCGQGSVGETFIKAPRVYNYSWCVPGVSWVNVACVVSMAPTAGGVRQLRVSQPSVSGYNSRVLTYAWGGPGMQYPAYGTLLHPSGKSFLFQTGMYYDGVRPLALVAPIPPVAEDTTPRQKYGVLQAPSIGPRTGATHARIRFGYNSSFYCAGADGTGGWNGHARACLTDASSADGFVFDGDTHAATSCSSGCSITVPWTPGRMGRMQVEYCTDSACGTQVGSPTTVQLVAVP
jgi:hypothetical protein